MSTAAFTTYVTLPNEHGNPEQALVIVDMNAAASALELGCTVGVVVPSDDDPEEHYIVTVKPKEGARHCTCKAGQHRRKCKHLARAEAACGFDRADLKRRQRDAKILVARVDSMLIQKRWAKVRRENLWGYCWTQTEQDIERAAQLYAEMAYRAVGARYAA